jgi:phenylalanyl-tRNA synthetase beta chain
LVAVLRAIELTQKLAGGQVASKIFDLVVRKKPTKAINFDLTSVKRYLGVEIPLSAIKNILTALGFGVSGQKILKVTVPNWRAGDVAFAYDLIEEIARVYGYHNLPSQLPTGLILPWLSEKKFIWQDRIKDFLVGLGFTEVYNYSMVAAATLRQAKFPPRKSLKIFNPLNEEMVYLRPTLLPQILQNLAFNLNNFPEQQIFELSQIYLAKAKKQLPNERWRLTGAITGGNHSTIFFQAKGVVGLLLKKLSITKASFVPPKTSRFLWQKNSVLDVWLGKKFLGQFGLISSKLLEDFSLNQAVAAFDFDFELLAQLAKETKVFQPLPEFPSVSRDFAFVLEQKVSWREIEKTLAKIHPFVVQLQYLSTFVTPELGLNKKSLALRLTFYSPRRTLTSAEVEKISQKVVLKMAKTFAAKLR